MEIGKEEGRREGRARTPPLVTQCSGGPELPRRGPAEGYAQLPAPPGHQGAGCWRGGLVVAQEGRLSSGQLAQVLEGCRPVAASSLQREGHHAPGGPPRSVAAALVGLRRGGGVRVVLVGQEFTVLAKVETVATGGVGAPAA